MQTGNSLLVIRNGRLGAIKKIKRTMRGMGLVKRHSAVFQPNSDEVTEKLHLCSPYVLWGCPDFKMIFNLIHKKVAIRNPGGEKAGPIVLSDNALIEEHLGDLGILCTEDLAHALHTGGEKVPDIMARLEPIKFLDIRRTDGMLKASTFVSGDQKEGINEHLNKLLG
mmetsp:Transcript_41791/g.93972  ORF Transcript_41791/g.93972 Transcript_41791/m.93972 type:complete len:167 (-) Transcript_41791:71-571(-)